MYSCACVFFTGYLIGIPFPDKTAKKVVQGYVQHIYIYATFSGSLTLTFDNGKKLNNDLSKKSPMN